MRKVRIESEIGRLRRVVVHSPGPEIEAMTPREAERDLYNDIIPLAVVQQEYTKLRDFLSLVATTYELTDLLEACLSDERGRLHFLQEYSRIAPIAPIIDELMAFTSKELAHAVLSGIIAPKNSLARCLNPHCFMAAPLPNAYFMRDSLAVIGSRIVSAAFAFDVRIAEAYVSRFVFLHHPDFQNDGILIDGPEERNRLITIEGGDIHVLSPQVLVLGISERTTAFAVDHLARRLACTADSPMTIFAVDLPKERATIHLDMVFTMIDRHTALAYKPAMVGAQRARVYRLEAEPQGEIHYQEEKTLFDGLRKIGIELEPVFCGNGHSVYQEREQWLSGANSFAFAPGKILMYSCNTYTLDALSTQGFAIVSAQDFLGGQARPEDYERLVVTFDGIELARGGGGARCMTLPVERETIDL